MRAQPSAGGRQVELLWRGRLIEPLLLDFDVLGIKRARPQFRYEGVEPEPPFEVTRLQIDGIVLRGSEERRQDLEVRGAGRGEIVRRGRIDLQGVGAPA